MTARLRLIAAVAAVTFAVVACGGTSPFGDAGRPPWLLSDHLGLPKGVTTVGLPGLGVRDVVLRSGAAQLDVVTWGSSGCPRLPIRLVIAPSNALSVTMSDGAAPAGSSCTADAAPTTSDIQVPTTIDLAQSINVTIIDGVYGLSIALPPA